MVDTRFHRCQGPFGLTDLVAGSRLLSPLSGDLVREIYGAEELHWAGPGEVALAASRRYEAALRDTRAGAVVVPKALVEMVPPGTLAIVSADPMGVFIDILERLYPNDTAHAMAGANQAGPDAFVEDGVRLGANVYIGQGVEIGTGTSIGPNTVIGAGVTIGRHAVIGANCTIECAHLGDRVVIQPGARIGAEGFGWTDLGRSNRKIPQLGRVIVQDRVEVGANTTIDRGALGDTVIGEGTKIDNLVQIGHNTKIGRFCLLAGMTGIAGSTVIEDGVMMGGGSGTAGHLTVGAGSIVQGRGSVTHSVPPGSKLAGTPAQDVRAYLRQKAWVRRMTKGDGGDS